MPIQQQALVLPRHRATKFKATFSLADAAPLVSPQLCDVGSLVITDTEDKLSISGGQLVYAGGKAAPAWGDPGIWTTTLWPRKTGRAILARITISDASKKVMFGFDGNRTGEIPMGLFNNADALRLRIAGGTGGSLGVLLDGVTYDMAVVQRNLGHISLLKLSADTLWTVLYAEYSSAVANWYGGLSNNDAVFTADNMRVIDLGGAWANDYGIARAYVASPGAVTPTLGAEYLSNGNMEAGDPPDDWPSAGGSLRITPSSSADERTGGGGTASLQIARIDSFGRARQLAFAGGDVGKWVNVSAWFKRVDIDGQLNLQDGVGDNTIIVTDATWTQHTLVARIKTTAAYVGLQVRVGVGAETNKWDDVSAKPITLSSTLGTVYNKHADYLAEVSPTLTAGTQAGLMLNIDDESNPANFILAYHDGTNVHLDKCVAGTYTSLISEAAAYAGGRRPVVIKDGTSVTLYYNNVKIGATQTISDAGVKDNTKHSWFSTYAGNSFANFVIWPRTVTLPQGV